MPEPDLLDDALMRDLEARFGRKDFVALVEIYLRDAPERARAIAAAAVASDEAALRRHAHDLTTSSGTIGIKAVHALSRDIEIACKTSDPAEAVALAGVLTVAIDASVAALRARFPEAKS
jgi:HPt (histidine-containing phosphotransfer) domain-containing protein